MNKKQLLIGLILFSLLTLSFQLYINGRIENVNALNRYNHEYKYSSNGILTSILTTNDSLGDGDIGTLVQSLRFDSVTGLFIDVYVITAVNESNGIVNYNSQSLKIDSSRNVKSYNFYRDFNWIGGKYFNIKKQKYKKLK